MLQLTKLTRSRPNSEADTGSSLKTLSARRYQRDMKRLIHRNEPNRPHISSDISISNNVETIKTEMRPIVLARPASITSDFLLRRVAPSASPLPDGPSGAPPVHHCASGKGGSKVSTPNPQALFQRNMHLL